MEDWKKELKQLKLAYLKHKSPDFYRLSGSEKMKVKTYTDQTTNGLTGGVYDYLKFSGHYVNRVNSQGQMRKIKGKMQFTQGTSNQGTADLDAIIYGKPVKIEIKCKATGDRMRKDQLKEQKRIEAAGGLYIIVTDMPSFVKWYKEFDSKQTNAEVHAAIV